MNDLDRDVIVIDCDGVLANWALGFCYEGTVIAGSTIDTGLTPAMYYNYDEIPTYSTDGWEGWTKRLVENTWRWVNTSRNWFSNLLPIDADKDNCWALRRIAEKRKLYIVTARPDCYGTAMNELTQRWVEERFGVRVNVIAESHGKERVIHALRPKWVLDDSPYVIDTLSNLHISQPVVRSYNFNATSPGPRVRSLAQFAELIGVD